MEIHGAVFSGAEFWGPWMKKQQLWKYMALCSQGLWENKGSTWGSVFQVQFSSSVGKLWKCMELFFSGADLGGPWKEKTTKEVHGTVFSGSLGKLRKCMALCF